MRYFTSDLSGKKFPVSQKLCLMFVRSTVYDFIKMEYPLLDESKYIALSELQEYRQKYIEFSLKNEFDELSSLETEVIHKVQDNDFISQDVEKDYTTRLTIGQRVADKVAAFGGSWKFIISFLIIIVLWIFINTYSLLSKPFDPFPFILLNLFLSCLAAFQAPVIMMSQNRQDEKDR